jgi:hypothetical protein
MWPAGGEVSIEDESDDLACLAVKGAAHTCYWSAKMYVIVEKRF